VTDPFEQLHKIKRALAAAGMADEALALDGVLNANASFASALGFDDGWAPAARNRGYDAALASMKIDRSNSKNATRLIQRLTHYRQFGADRQGGEDALQIILRASGGKIQSHSSYRRKFAKV
jgi:hypothetical protein